MENYGSFSAPFGHYTLYDDGCSLTRLIFADVKGGKPTPLILAAARQLDEYFAGKRKYFDLPLAPKGTAFQQIIWTILRQIPYGETISYKQLAAAAGNEKACRAAGGANNKNPLPVFIPCHRVIGANGSLTGYAGGLKIKQFLLELEQRCR